MGEGRIAAEKRHRSERGRVGMAIRHRAFGVLLVSSALFQGK